MKKVLFIAAFAALFAISCQKEIDPVSGSNDNSFSFSANAPDLKNPGTKASINDSHGLVWSAGDKIGIYVNDSSWKDNEARHNPFTLVGEGGTTSAQFAWDYDDGNFTSTLATVAFFPWQGRDNAGTYNNYFDNNVYFKLAGSYDGYTSGKMLTPLVASITRTGDAYDPISFNHAGGAVKVKVSDLPAGAHSIGMTAATQQIHGNYSIAVADAGTANMSLNGDADLSKKAIWLNFEPIASSRPFTFLFPVPALNENEKLSFQIYDKNDVLVWSRSVSSHEAINHGEVLLLGSDEAISIEPYRQLKEVSTEWGVCGNFTSWGSDSDIEMITDGESCVVKGLALDADAEFKIRTKGSWTTSYGSGALTKSEAYAEGHEGNVKIKSAGDYDIVFNISNEKIYVAPTGECPYPSKAHHYTSIKNATELGTTETANCYVITEAGSYSIPVVKGNSNESAGTVGGVELLWETYNNAEDVTPNSVIEAVDWDERDASHIFFKTPATLKPGNALIAAKNASGEIIWSWHIWIPASTLTDIGDYTVSKRYLMDRNLGAIVPAVEPVGEGTVDVRSVGLFYQWGRKDPFVGYKWGKTRIDIGVSGGYRTRSSTKVSIAGSIAAPTTMIQGASDARDWLTESDNSLWGHDAGKTIYDPCPAGYRVPDYDTSDALWKSGLASSDNFSASVDGHWWKLGNVVFPCSGYFYYSSGDIDGEYNKSYLWSAQAKNDTYGEVQYVYYANSAWASAHDWGLSKSSALSIRCVKVAGEVLPPIPVGAKGVTLATNGTISSDWSKAEAISDSSDGIKEWKYGYDSSNLYFYFKIRRGAIKALDAEPYSYRTRRYIYFALDTDNDSSSGVKPSSGDYKESGFEVLGLVYPFDGNALTSGGTDGTLNIINNLDDKSYTKILSPEASKKTTYEDVYAYGNVQTDYVYVEISVPRADIGISSSFTGIMKVQFSLSSTLTSLARIELKKL